MREDVPVMPSLEAGCLGFHHTVDSALRVLSDLGVSASRVTLRMAGRGHPPQWVVAQDPKVGVPLTADVKVKLSVSGLGYFHDLPVGMWDMGGEDAPGTREILEPLDDPLQKAGHWIREGAKLFDIKLSNFEACSRWISLFGLRPADWPVETWHPLALLLTRMQTIAGTEEGIRLAFELLLQVQVNEIRFFPSTRSLPEQDWSLLGYRSSRLGVDAIVGNQLEDAAGVWIIAGPISLSVYKEFQEDEKKRLLTNVLALTVSCQRRCRVSWLVEDRRRSPRLGYERENGRLGINSHLGRLAAAG